MKMNGNVQANNASVNFPIKIHVNKLLWRFARNEPQRGFFGAILLSLIFVFGNRRANANSGKVSSIVIYFTRSPSRHLYEPFGVFCHGFWTLSWNGYTCSFIVILRIDPSSFCVSSSYRPQNSPHLKSVTGSSQNLYQDER
jgi:hypothetical protein